MRQIKNHSAIICLTVLVTATLHIFDASATECPDTSPADGIYTETRGSSEHGFFSRLRGGVEWGYTQGIWHWYHYNYLTDAMARVNSEDGRFVVSSNGHIYAYIGYQIGRRWQLDLISGWAGIWQDRRVVPIDLRATRYFSGLNNNGFKAFFEVGELISHNVAGSDFPSNIMKLGGGFRIMLTSRSAVDLSLSLQRCIDHPADIHDPAYNYDVAPDHLRRSDTSYTGINFSISINL